MYDILVFLLLVLRIFHVILIMPKSCYRNFDAIFGKIGKTAASENVIMQLIKSSVCLYYCMLSMLVR